MDEFTFYLYRNSYRNFVDLFGWLPPKFCGQFRFPSTLINNEPQFTYGSKGAVLAFHKNFLHTFLKFDIRDFLPY
jgi:hypothetical protein